ncbi:MAG: acyl carrier protein [Spirochaetaceae bacterium]|nr:acyl carrier protein [Spirochaetaceae bacterium]MBQ3025585.1 acyl carrier protein [Spirochaetaceae bacterium]MBQ7904315.1 acyl carrier protein [Spirochaetaceae bacterium]
MDELFVKMQKLIAEKLEIDESKITLESSFRQDLGADSLDTYELVYAIEEELGIKIDDEKANEFETVGDAYNFVKSQM